jgi:hypothetical protein
MFINRVGSDREVQMFSSKSFTSIPEAAENYQEAIEKFRAIEKTESALPLCPEGRSRLLIHGHKAERVIVLLHGLTNCPEQFIPLAGFFTHPERTSSCLAPAMPDSLTG